MLYIPFEEGNEYKPKQEEQNKLHDLTIDVSDLVAHGEADELIASVVHDKHLVHAEHLGGFDVSQGLAVLAALEGDGLTPLIRPGVGGAVWEAHHVVPGGGRGDYWKVGGELYCSFLSTSHIFSHNHKFRKR